MFRILNASSFSRKKVNAVFIYFFDEVYDCRSSWRHTACSQYNKQYSRVVGDYDTSKLKGSFIDSENEAYQIGQNRLGRPVFKSTQKAWDAFIVDYAVGIATIQEAFNLNPISKDDYQFYSTYGFDMPEGYSAEIEEQCKDVSYFLLIYANSFR